MSQDNLIKLVHTIQDDKTGKKKTTHTYWTRKNKKKLANHKIELKKFNPVLKKHVMYKEAKK
ncbi:MAG: 50S ribosomal protein L33 [Candidatus Pacebacteria bacterium]|nr:50S ribosomal protein L33 [Candidatus Paceibacterota bacterium]MCD8563568.1 50S ribosomal protein L33 [Candidatus Paceibacterota bacterium]